MKAAPVTVLMSGLLFVGWVTGRAQDASRDTVFKPCADERPSSRPVLKKRQLTSGGESIKFEQALDQVKCRADKEEAPPDNRPKITMKFEGLVNSKESDLRRYLEEQQEDVKKSFLSPGPEYFDAVAALIKTYLAASGYLNAKVSLRAAQANGESFEVVFLIDEGVRPSISEYRFEGNRVFSSATLAENLRECMMRYARDHYESEISEYCIRKLADYERGSGYLQAHFGDPKIVDVNGGLVITIPAEEGVLYRVGDIKFDGDLLTPADKLPALCPIKKGDIANGELLAKWLFQDLKQLYGERGYIQYTAEVNPQFRTPPGAEGVVDLAITIDAGRRFKVHRIRFAGDNIPDNLLELMLLHDCDIYDQSLFEKSIDKLNNTGLFEFIDKDKDTDYESNEEEGLLDITIKLTRKRA